MSQYDKFADKFSKKQLSSSQKNRSDFYATLPQSLTGMSLLDLGCGDGTDCIYFVETLDALSVIGIDESVEQLRIAEHLNKHTKISYKKMSFSEMAFFGSESFDLIVSKYALAHSSKALDTFSQAYELLKPGGIFLILVTHPLRSFLASKSKDYFQKERVEFSILDDTIPVKETNYTFGDYIKQSLKTGFVLEDYQETYDPAAETYSGFKRIPGFMILKFRK